MTLVLITIALIALLMVGMSIGVILQGRCLRGSCGGPDVLGPDGESLSCASCPLKKQREQEQRRAEREAGRAA